MRLGQMAMMAATLAAVAGCNRSQPRDTTVPLNQAAPAAPAAPLAPAAPATPVSSPEPSKVAPLPAPTPPVAPNPPAPTPPVTPDASDPKSVDAALAVARDFAALVSARKFEQAYALMNGRGGFESAADFRRHFAPYSSIDLTVLDTPAPQPEGAAGSIYLTVPAQLSGMAGGRRVHHPATITLRRVNDVPGSTEAQRRWHIEGFDDKVK